jgi:hypothetical protein
MTNGTVTKNMSYIHLDLQNINQSLIKLGEVHEERFSPQDFVPTQKRDAQYA